MTPQADLWSLHECVYTPTCTHVPAHRHLYIQAYALAFIRSLIAIGIEDLHRLKPRFSFLFSSTDQHTIGPIGCWPPSCHCGVVAARVGVSCMNRAGLRGRWLCLMNRAGSGIEKRAHGIICILRKNLGLGVLHNRFLHSVGCHKRSSPARCGRGWRQLRSKIRNAYSNILVKYFQIL